MNRILLIVSLLAVLLTSCDNHQMSENNAQRVIAELHDPSSDNVLVVSHRGDWRNWPENSIEAIQSVIDMGVDIVEIDIALTRDSVLILMHDRTIDRTTTGRGKVSELLYDSIRNCRLRLQHGVASQYRIPTLEEALWLCKDKIVINLDKGYDYYDQVMTLLEKTGTTDQILIKGSRKPETVKSVRARYAENMMYMPVIDYRRSTAQELFDLYKAGDAPIAYEIVWNQMTPQVEECMKQVLAGGSRLWTNSLWPDLCGGLDDDSALSDPKAIYGKHLELGATIIQTDRPGLLMDYLRSVNRRK